MRVLFLSPGGSALGGAERSLALLIGGLVSRGHEAFVVVLTPGDAASMFRDAGASVIERRARLDRVRRHGDPLTFALGTLSSLPVAFETASAVRRHADEVRADIIHSNGFRTHMLAPLLRSRRARQVWSLRDVAPRAVQRAALSVASRAVDVIVANSRFTAAQFSMRRKRIEIVANAVEVSEQPDRDDARKALALGADRPVVAVAAHLHPSKGHHVLIEALSRWPECDRPCLAIAGLALYGDDSVRYESHLRHLVTNTGLERDVVFLGGVRDMGTLYAAADLLVQPAIHPEGFGRVVAEAQVAGVPVIATAIGAAPELIESGESGLLVPPNDAAALQHAMRKVLDGPDLATKLVVGGKAVADRYAVSYHVDRIERLYQRVLAS